MIIDIRVGGGGGGCEERNTVPLCVYRHTLGGDLATARALSIPRQAGCLGTLAWVNLKHANLNYLSFLLLKFSGSLVN